MLCWDTHVANIAKRVLTFSRCQKGVELGMMRVLRRLSCLLWLERIEGRLCLLLL